MQRTIFFSKVSMDSQEVYNLVEDYKIRFEITRNIISMLKHDFYFEDENMYFTDDGEKHIGLITYSLSIKEKDDEHIHGVLYRKAPLFVKERNNQKDEMKSKAVLNTEDIEFYYDVLHEYVGFYCRNRFGRNMFNAAFEKLLNECAKQNKYGYSFYVETFNAGMTIGEIQDDIKEDKNIKELTITYRPANPDELILKKIKDAHNKEKMQESNATERSVIYKAKGKSTINGGAEIIQDDLHKLVAMNEDIPILELTQRGYIVVTKVNQNGDVNTTTSNKPFVKIAHNDYEFIDTARKGIIEILGKGAQFD